MGNFNFQVIHIKTNFIAPFYGWGLNASRLQSHYEDAVTVISFNKKKQPVHSLMPFIKYKYTGTNSNPPFY